MAKRRAAQEERELGTPSKRAMERRRKMGERHLSIVAPEPEPNEEEGQDSEELDGFIRGLSQVRESEGSEPEHPVEDETTWSAPTPEDHPADVAAAMAHSVTVREVTDEDVDRLWDWVRAEADKGQRFLGRVMTTSKQLHEWVATFGPHLYAITDVDDHVGFVGFNPIVYPAGMPGQAVVHLFLSAPVRGQMHRIVPQLLDLAAVQYPGVTLRIITTEPGFAKLLQPFGFELSWVLTKVATVTVTGD